MESRNNELQKIKEIAKKTGDKELLDNAKKRESNNKIVEKWQN